ncbi:MAG: hypothetical protein WDA47_03820 [Bacilli bacterium]
MAIYTVKLNPTPTQQEILWYNRKLFLEAVHSLIPVYQENPRAKGYQHIKQLLLPGAVKNAAVSAAYKAAQSGPDFLDEMVISYNKGHYRFTAQGKLSLPIRMEGSYSTQRMKISCDINDVEKLSGDWGYMRIINDESDWRADIRVMEGKSHG